jgi:DNA-directed RNA polymerase specialized sigma24 family protein
MSASENVRDDGAESSDAFPTTHVAWIHARIDARLTEGASGHEALNTHVMSRYARPLATYARASALRAIDEPDALVNGFFATRLVRAEYLASWRASGLPLRRWLVNGLLLHGRERQREQRKAARDGAAAASPCGSCGCAGACAGGFAEVGLEPSAFEEFERAWSRALLTDACELAERELVAEGDADAWASFRQHNFDGLEYAEIAQQFRITPAEARTRARRAAFRFEHALRRLLSDEGVAESDLDEEIAWLMEVSTR